LIYVEIFIGPTTLCHTYAILCISCAIALSHSMKALSACINVRLAVRCFYAISLSHTGFCHFTFALCFASGLHYWFRILLCFDLSFLIDLSFGSLFRSSRSFINIPDYTPHEIIDMILILGECRGNLKAARLYREQ